MKQPRVSRPAVRWSGGLLVGALMIAAVSGVVALLDPQIPAPYMFALYSLVVVAMAIWRGTALGAVIAAVSAVTFAYLFVPPRLSWHIDDASTLLGIAVFVLTAIVVGGLTARLRQSAMESARLSDEQSALRRIATLVANSASPPTVFEAVTKEVGMLSGADLARLERFEPDGTVTGMAGWSRVPDRLTVGTRFALGGPSIAREVQQTGGPVRIASFSGATGPIADEARSVGIRSSVGCPITVGGRLWGVIAASTKSNEPFPVNTESQIANFTELVETAIANAEGRSELEASRARVVAAADEARQRLERNLHDGAQQRLVSLTLKMRLTLDTLPAEATEHRAELGWIIAETTEVLEELRELSRGLHPAILAHGGLGAALRALGRRSAIDVEVDVDGQARYPAPAEVAAYYVVAEALTNTSKHAGASRVEVVVAGDDATLHVCVSDDGVGGADPQRGSGLIGLRDRIEALGGSIDVTSPVGSGTTIRVSIPLVSRDGNSSSARELRTP